MTIDTWENCYDGNWQGLICPEAFAHPAKYSYALICRIVKHAIEEGWLQKDSVCVDPFGGIGSGGIVAAYEGIQWIGCELEPEFNRLASGYDCPGLTKTEWVRWYNRFRKNPDICPGCHAKAQGWYEKHSGQIPTQEPHRYAGNFELHENAWRKLGCPRPVMIQGDSRQLSEIIGQAECIVSSPPFLQSEGGFGEKSQNAIDPKLFKRHFAGMGNSPAYGSTPGQLGAMKPGNVDAVIASPPYAETLKGDGTQSETAQESRTKRRTEGGSLGQSQRTQGYGSKGNLGNLKPGDVSCVISSPPYAQLGADTKGHGIKNAKGSIGHGCKADNAEYGSSPGNIANLKPGDPPQERRASVAAIIASPPFMLSDNRNGDKSDKLPRQGVSIGPKYSDETPTDGMAGGDRGSENAKAEQRTRAETIKNLGHIVAMGNDGKLINTETFWSAALQIVSECFQILRPGGHAIWVVKAFVRNKKIVDFPGDWRRLCEAVGFETLHEHHASLVKEDVKDSLFGHKIVKRKERKSFFRRLAESKGSPRIDYECVLCMRKAGPIRRVSYDAGRV